MPNLLTLGRHGLFLNNSMDDNVLLGMKVGRSRSRRGGFNSRAWLSRDAGVHEPAVRGEVIVRDAVLGHRPAGGPVLALAAHRSTRRSAARSAARGGRSRDAGAGAVVPVSLVSPNKVRARNDYDADGLEDRDLVSGGANRLVRPVRVEVRGTCRQLPSRAKLGRANVLERDAADLYGDRRASVPFPTGVPRLDPQHSVPRRLQLHRQHASHCRPKTQGRPAASMRSSWTAGCIREQMARLPSMSVRM